MEVVVVVVSDAAAGVVVLVSAAKDAVAKQATNAAARIAWMNFIYFSIGFGGRGGHGFGRAEAARPKEIKVAD